LTSLRIQTERLDRYVEELERKRLQEDVRRTRVVTAALAPGKALELYKDELKKHGPEADEASSEGHLT
jgi:ribosomal protein L12E/L44/L45/RPP1/RPP2